MPGQFAVPMLQPEDVIPHLARGRKHWRDGRSAKELARRWWEAGGFPPSVETLLRRCPEWNGVVFIEAKFEHRTDLGTPGRASQTDLLVIASTSEGNGIVAVEGKADESFGQVVEAWLAKGVDQNNAAHRIGGIASTPGKIARLESLCRILKLDIKSALVLRYQLLHRTVAALLEAKRFGCHQALVLVHHFSADADSSASSLSDFVQFGEAVGAPISGVDPISQPVVLDGVQLRLAWVEDNCNPRHGIGVRELIFALGMARCFEGVENELARYWQLRFAILTELFGLPGAWEEDKSRTPRMLLSLAQAICDIGFFESFLEYSWMPGEREIYEQHKVNVEAREELYREALLDFAEELLLKYWPNVQGKRFTEEELISKGLSASEPDSIDFI